MIKVPSYETARLKFRDKVFIPISRDRRRRQLSTTDFSIISNNCWAGTVYESYGLQKQTPTAGMFIMPDDYLTLINDFESNLSQQLQFIVPAESKWRATLEKNADWGSYLIGRIGDIELHMLHYHDEETARRKWESRVQRINLQKIIFKFNDQNGATDMHMQKFDSLNLDHKILFTVRDMPNLACAVKIQAPSRHKCIQASYEPIAGLRGFDPTKFINSCFEQST